VLRNSAAPFSMNGFFNAGAGKKASSGQLFQNTIPLQKLNQPCCMYWRMGF
jgi:hypothetical protein